MGVRQPPTFETMKIKNATWCAGARPRFIWSQGRMRSIEAPVVPSRLRCNGPEEQEKGVRAGRCPAFDAEVNAAGDHEERADEHDETEILVSGLQHALGRAQDEDVVARCDGGQPGGELGVVPGPPGGLDHGRNRDDCQQQPEGQDHPRVRFQGLAAHEPKLPPRSRNVKWIWIRDRPSAWHCQARLKGIFYPRYEKDRQCRGVGKLPRPAAFR